MGENSLTSAVMRLQSVDRVVDVLEIVRSAARAAAVADGATVVLREDDNCFYADEDAMSPLWKGQRFPVTECISGWAMLHGMTAVVPDITLDDRIPIEAYRPTFVKSLVMVPVGERPTVGAIGAYWADRHIATEEQLAALHALASATAEALERVGNDDVPFTPRDMASADS